jgi:hypothetical protein
LGGFPAYYLKDQSKEVSVSQFVALYSGATVNSSEILALSADPRIVREFAARLLEQPPKISEDPAVVSIEEGRRKALEVVRDERA